MFVLKNLNLNKFKKLYIQNQYLNFKLNYSKSTTDLNEIKKFDKFSDEFNWFTSKKMKPLRNLNHLRIPLIRDQLCILNNLKNLNMEYPLNGLNILDVGCGGGLLSIPLANLGANVTAIDANSKTIDFAKSYLITYSSHLKARLNYMNTNIEEFSKSKTNLNTFDSIIASEVLEHIDNVEIFIKCCYQLLKKNGLLFITTINQSLKSYLLVILLAENILNLVPKGTHTYEKLVLFNGLCLILKENNFHIDLVHGIKFNPITKNWSWSIDNSMNYALVARKF